MPAVSISPSLQIYLVRHGETQSNLAGRFSGQGDDSQLTVRGIAEAQRNGSVLRERVGKSDGYRLLSSPLGRAVHTAELIGGEIGAPPPQIETEPRLTEISFGAWEGLTKDEIERDYPGEWDRRHREMWSYAMPGGESYAQVARRAGEWLAEAEGPMIVVTHGAVERILRGLYAGLPEREICHLGEPQNVVFKLADGTVEVI